MKDPLENEIKLAIIMSILDILDASGNHHRKGHGEHRADDGIHLSKRGLH